MITLGKFIEDHIDLIDDEKWTELFKAAFDKLEETKVPDIVSMLKVIGISEDTLYWGSIEGEILSKIQFELDHNYFNQDRANSWSRVRWMLYGIYTYNYSHDQIVQHLIDNKDRLNLKMTPLDSEYSYDGSDEYDLGWFKPQYYNPEE